VTRRGGNASAARHGSVAEPSRHRDRMPRRDRRALYTPVTCIARRCAMSRAWRADPPARSTRRSDRAGALGGTSTRDRSPRSKPGKRDALPGGDLKTRLRSAPLPRLVSVRDRDQRRGRHPRHWRYAPEQIRAVVDARSDLSLGVMRMSS
jgi:hypothetical protein